MPLPSYPRYYLHPWLHYYTKWCCGHHWSWLTTADQWVWLRRNWRTTTHHGNPLHNSCCCVNLGLCPWTELSEKGIEIYLPTFLSWTHLVENFLPLNECWAKRESPRVDSKLLNPSNVRTYVPPGPTWADQGSITLHIPFLNSQKNEKHSHWHDDNWVGFLKLVRKDHQSFYRSKWNEMKRILGEVSQPPRARPKLAQPLKQAKSI